MAHTIVVANQKGGVGKTTTVANLGTALALQNKRVLLIDMDPQAALTATYGMDPYNLPRSMYSVLIHENMSIARILRPVGPDSRMALAPASVDLATAEVQLVDAEGRAQRLQRALERSQIPFDYVLIDTPPSLNLLTLNALVASQSVLVPVQCHYLAMRGVRSLMETIWRVKRRLNPDLRLLGLLPTMYATESAHAEEVVRELREVFGNKVFEIVIEQNVAFAEAPVARKSLVETQPSHAGALAYRRLAEEIMADHV